MGDCGACRQNHRKIRRRHGSAHHAACGPYRAPGRRQTRTGGQGRDGQGRAIRGQTYDDPPGPMGVQPGPSGSQPHRHGEAGTSGEQTARPQPQVRRWDDEHRGCARTGRCATHGGAQPCSTTGRGSDGLPHRHRSGPIPTPPQTTPPDSETAPKEAQQDAAFSGEQEHRLNEALAQLDLGGDR